MTDKTPHGEPCYSPNCPHTIKVVGHTGDDDICRQCGHHIETESSTPESIFSLHDDLIAAMRILHELHRSPEEFCLGNRLRMAAEEMEKPVAATSESTQLKDTQFQLRSVVVLDLGYDGHEPAGSTTPLRHMFAWRYGFAGMDLEARHAAVNYIKGLVGKEQPLPLPEQLADVTKELGERTRELAEVTKELADLKAQLRIL